MKKHHREKVSFADQEDPAVDEVLAELAATIAEETQARATGEGEPFEAYIYKVRSKVHKDLPLFRSRLTEGYHVLLKELQKEAKTI